MWLLSFIKGRYLEVSEQGLHFKKRKNTAHSTYIVISDNVFLHTLQQIKLAVQAQHLQVYRARHRI